MRRQERERGYVIEIGSLGYFTADIRRDTVGVVKDPEHAVLFKRVRDARHAVGVLQRAGYPATPICATRLTRVEVEERQVVAGVELGERLR